MPGDHSSSTHALALPWQDEAILALIFQLMPEDAVSTLRLVCKEWLATTRSLNLQLEPRGNFTDAQLRRLLQQYPFMSSLSMLTTERKLLRALPAFPQITALSLKQAKQGLGTAASWRRQLKSLSKLIALKELHIHNMLYHHISPVSVLTGLCSLSVHKNSPLIFSRFDNLSEQEVNSISVLHSLTHLQLEDCPTVKCIAALSNLRSLKFTGGFDLDQADRLSRLTRLDWNYQLDPTRMAGVRAAQSMTGLKHLCFKAVVLHGLEHFSALSKLTTLKLDTCEAMHEHDIDTLSVLTNLHDLTLCYGVPDKKMQIKVKIGVGAQVSTPLTSVSELEYPSYWYGDFFGQGM